MNLLGAIPGGVRLKVIMDFDNSWKALLKPGETTLFFDAHGQAKFQSEKSDFSHTNAWWLAEFSRLIYRFDANEVLSPPAGPTRQDFLSGVGLQELKFIRSEKAQCAVIKPLMASDVQFRALVFRGADELMDWLTNLGVRLIRWAGAGLVHEGFRDAFETVWPEVESLLVEEDSPIFYTGHSLGAALATLAAARRPPQALYTYGSPSVGDKVFTASLSGVRAYRVVNNRDIVTTVPPPLGYHHAGELHYITHDGSIVVNPDDITVALDRLKRDSAGNFLRELNRVFTDAPEQLADHAPVNYVAHLERAI
jgi:triacylglycerol lipase